MRKLTFVVALTLSCSLVGLPAMADTFNDLLNGEDTPGYTMTDAGVIRERNIADRTIVINGFMYLVGNSFETSVTLLNTSAGAFELLDEGMKAEVEYFDLEDIGRLAIRITQIGYNEDIEY
jgi:hypothetical protein